MVGKAVSRPECAGTAGIDVALEGRHEITLLNCRRQVPHPLDRRTGTGKPLLGPLGQQQKTYRRVATGS
jgi:hypothetical protein